MSVRQLSHSVMSNSLRPHVSQHTRPPCLSPTPGVHPDSRPSSQWCHPAISSSVVPFSSCPKSLPASESFPMSQLFTFPPKKSQGWSPSEWTGWISLQSKGLSRVFSNTIVQKHQFMCRLSYIKENVFFILYLFQIFFITVGYEWLSTHLKELMKEKIGTLCDSFLIFYWSIIYTEQKNKSKLMSFDKFIYQCDLHS